MLINRQKEAYLHDATDALIGLSNVSEKWVRWQFARLLIRWNALVIKGEDSTNPSALAIRKSLDELLVKLKH